MPGMKIPGCSVFHLDWLKNCKGLQRTVRRRSQVSAWTAIWNCNTSAHGKPKHSPARHTGLQAHRPRPVPLSRLAEDSRSRRFWSRYWSLKACTAGCTRSAGSKYSKNFASPNIGGRRSADLSTVTGHGGGKALKRALKRALKKVLQEYAGGESRPAWYQVQPAKLPIGSRRGLNATTRGIRTF